MTCSWLVVKPHWSINYWLVYKYNIIWMSIDEELSMLFINAHYLLLTKFYRVALLDLFYSICSMLLCWRMRREIHNMASTSVFDLHRRRFDFQGRWKYTMLKFTLWELRFFSNTSLLRVISLSVQCVCVCRSIMQGLTKHINALDFIVSIWTVAWVSLSNSVASIFAAQDLCSNPVAVNN